MSKILELTEFQHDYISDNCADSIKEYFEEIHQAYPKGQLPADVRKELMSMIELAKMLNIIPYKEDVQWINKIP